jgi:hypothetical protein
MFWKLLEIPLRFMASLFWNLACGLMDVSLFFQDLDLKVYAHIDPVGIEFRRQQLERLVQMNDDSRNTW